MKYCYEVKVNHRYFGEVYTFDKELDEMLDTLETTFPKEELKAKWYETAYSVPIIGSEALLEELLRKTRGVYALAMDLEDIGFGTSKLKKRDLLMTITVLENALDYCRTELSTKSIMYRIHGENHIRLVRNKLSVVKRLKRNAKLIDQKLEEVLLEDIL